MNLRPFPLYFQNTARLQEQGDYSEGNKQQCLTDSRQAALDIVMERAPDCMQAGREQVKIRLEGNRKYSSCPQLAGIQSLPSQKRGALVRGRRLALRA